MTPEQFTYWLQGFIEMADPTSITEEQVNIIKANLNLVFDKKTPNFPFEQKHEEVMYSDRLWNKDAFYNMFAPIKTISTKKR